MTMPQRVKQAYTQAPWRQQTQRLAIVLILVILGAGMLWLMLSVSVMAGSAGLQIQDYESQSEELQRQIASLNTQYADLTSSTRMSKRAAELGFVQVKPGDLKYMTVPQYAGRQSEISPSTVDTVTERRLLVKPAYTESLWEWLLTGVSKVNVSKGGGTP